MIDSITKKQIVDIPYYECMDRISNSAIGWFLNKGPSYLHKKLSGEVEDETTSSMAKGTTIHMYLLQPEEFQKTYKVWTGAKPASTQQEKFCQEVARSVEIEPNKALLSAYKRVYSTAGKMDDNLLNKASELAKTLNEYIEYLKNPEYECISPYEYSRITKIGENIRRHKLASRLINPGTGELHHEFHINWELHGVKCKSLLDSVHFDFDNKVCTLMDLKTTAKIAHFEDSVNQYDYTRQLEFYTMALIWYLENERGEDPTKWHFDWYIIAIDSIGDGEIRVFKFTDDQVIGSAVKILYAIDEIKWHAEHNLWDYRRAYYEGDGSETLSL